MSCITPTNLNPGFYNGSSSVLHQSTLQAELKCRFAEPCVRNSLSLPRMAGSCMSVRSESHDLVDLPNASGRVVTPITKELHRYPFESITQLDRRRSLYKNKTQLICIRDLPRVCLWCQLTPDSTIFAHSSMIYLLQH